jgi:hypothetical protein
MDNHQQNITVREYYFLRTMCLEKLAVQDAGFGLKTTIAAY